MTEDKATALELLPEEHDVDLVEVAVKLLGPVYSKKYRELPKELLEATEEELEKLVEPHLTDRKIRISFWSEVRRVVQNAEAVVVPSNIYKGICSKQNFYLRILAKPERLAWVMRPPKDYQKQADEIIDYGLGKLRDALNCKVQFNNGHMDTKAVKVMLDILQYFEARTKGPLKQRVEIESKSMNTNVTIDVNQSMDEIENRIAEARKRVAEYEGKALIQGVPEVVDVEARE